MGKRHISAELISFSHSCIAKQRRKTEKTEARFINKLLSRKRLSTVKKNTGAPKEFGLPQKTEAEQQWDIEVGTSSIGSDNR